MSVLLCDNVTKNNNIYNFSFNFLDKNTYAILGKNDSGKATLFDVLSSKTSYDMGHIWLDGEELSDSKKSNRVCYIKKNAKFSNTCFINNIFKKMSQKYPKWDNYYAFKLCEYFDINPNSLYGSLAENKKHLLIGICALASKANITIIDDPLFDSDIKERYDFYKFLYDDKIRYPRTFIISSEKIDDISFLFDKVLFLDNGKLIDFFTLNELSENFKYLTGKTEVLRPLISDLKILGSEERNGNLSVCIYKKLSKDEKRKFQKYLIDITDVPIDNIFIYLTNLRMIRNKKITIF